MSNVRKLYAAFLDLENVYDRVDRETLWRVLRIYGEGTERNTYRLVILEQVPV